MRALLDINVIRNNWCQFIFQRRPLLKNELTPIIGDSVDPEHAICQPHEPKPEVRSDGLECRPGGWLVASEDDPLIHLAHPYSRRLAE